MKAITKKIGFIGAGVMATAIAKAMLDSDLVDSSNVYVSAPSNNNLGWWREVGANTTNDNNDIVDTCPVVILAMKPQYVEHALGTINRVIVRNNSTIFISVLAGISTSHLKQILYQYMNFQLKNENELQIFRVVPNTAISVGAGCTAYCYSIGPSYISQKEETINLVETIFNAGGACVEVSEDILPAVSALSGSGVAYVYVMIEALCDGAVRMGVPRPLATKLAVQTFLGATKMVELTGKHPGLLKDEVCSAGGTTIAAIHAMEKAGIRGGLIDAIEAAVKRSYQLANKDK